MKFWCAGFIFLGFAHSVFAQDVADYVVFAPRSDWALSIDVPDFNSEDDADRNKVYPLVDYQNRYSLTTDEYSTRYVVDLLTPTAVEKEGTISLDFDPSYETMTLHHVKIIRNDLTLNAIDLTDAMIFRTETDRDQMIFNGTMTFSLPVHGLRVGDRLDVSVYARGPKPGGWCRIFGAKVV